MPPEAQGIEARMRSVAMQVSAFEERALLRRIVLVAAVLYLALVQVLSAAHAFSGDANAPNHHTSACAVCVAAHGASAGLPSGDIETPTPPAAFDAVAPIAGRPLTPTQTYAPVSRGPPSY